MKMLIFLIIVISCASKPAQELNSKQSTQRNEISHPLLIESENNRVFKIKKFIAEHPQYQQYSSVAIAKEIEVGMPEFLFNLSVPKTPHIKVVGSRKEYFYNEASVVLKHGFVAYWTTGGCGIR